MYAVFFVSRTYFESCFDHVQKIRLDTYKIDREKNCSSLNYQGNVPWALYFPFNLNVRLYNDLKFEFAS